MGDDELKLDGSCKVCLGQLADTLLLPCAHMVLCGWCADELGIPVSRVVSPLAVSPIVPFGGYGLSGLGREGGLDAVLDYTRTKSVWIRTSDEPIADPFVMR